jgi:hypothetical protein
MTTFTTAQILEMAKEFAESNYDNGMAYFVECYDDSEWLDFVEGRTLIQVLSNMVTSAFDREELKREVESQ